MISVRFFLWLVTRAGIVAATVMLVVSVAERYPRLGALLLTLPLISIISFVAGWYQYHEIATVSRLARETLVLVPLGLPFFVPLAFAERWSLDFWPAFTLGLLLASITILAWLWFGPRLS